MPTHDDRMMTEGTEPGQVQMIQSRRGIERGVQQDAVDDEPHEQRLDHLQPVPMSASTKSMPTPSRRRPPPTQIFAEVLAPSAAQQRRLALSDRPVSGFTPSGFTPRRSAACRWLRPYGRRAAVAVVANEELVTLS
jgi:hypothetical protein